MGMNHVRRVYGIGNTRVYNLGNVAPITDNAGDELRIIILLAGG